MHARAAAAPAQGQGHCAAGRFGGIDGPKAAANSGAEIRDTVLSNTGGLKLAYEKDNLDSESVIGRGRDVIRLEADALASMADALGETFAEACRAILQANRQLVVTGMGKSGHIARKAAATFAATGTPAIYLHPSEAAHGDLGMLAPGDILLVLSNSGNTFELKPVLTYARRLGIPVIGVAAQSRSLVMQYASIKVNLPPMREACSAGLAPTTSTTVQLALMDAMAMAVMDMRGVSRSHLGSLHPGGSIGMALTPVSDLMRTDEALPLVDEGAAMPNAISVMTGGCVGVAGVLDSRGCLVGLITDGDLRRHFDVLTTATAGQVMTPSPKVVPAGMLAGEALQLLNRNRITAAFVVADAGAEAQPPIGIIHIHDLLRYGLG